MIKRTQRTYSAAFKAKAARVVVKGERTLAELAQQFDVHPNQIMEWKQQLRFGQSCLAIHRRLHRAVHPEAAPFEPGGSFAG